MVILCTIVVTQIANAGKAVGKFFEGAGDYFGKGLSTVGDGLSSAGGAFVSGAKAVGETLNPTNWGWRRKRVCHLRFSR